MNLTEFVQNFAEQFFETEPSEITAETEFRNIEEWSSLTSLSVIAMVDEVYEAKLTGDDIRKSVTVEDIFNIIKAKM